MSVLHSRRSQHSEKPERRKEKQHPLEATKESSQNNADPSAAKNKGKNLKRVYPNYFLKKKQRESGLPSSMYDVKNF